MIRRKITAMHDAYGIAHPPHVCKDCRHFFVYDYHDRRYFKCQAYGLSNGEATDWRAKYPACGLYNQQKPETPLLEMLKHESRKEPEKPIEGQITFAELEG